MKRIVLVTIPMALCLLILAMRPAEGQDNLQDRVSMLETRVAELEAIVGGVSVETTPTLSVTHTITGSLTLYGDRTGTYPNVYVSGTECIGANGYDDIGPGGAVTIRDGNDTTIAVGRLDDGKWKTGGTCVFPFTVSNVPDSDFYSVEVTHRGQVFASKEELVENRWRIELVLGHS